MSRFNSARLYDLVSTAREQTAGANVQPLSTVAQSLTTAIEYAKHVIAPEELIRKLENCRENVLKAKILKHRLEVDDILCAMLNNEIGEYNGKT
jgi:hypothetical protein